MTSLCFTNTHLAWQQRVQKEISSKQYYGFQPETLRMSYDKDEIFDHRSENKQHHSSSLPTENRVGLASTSNLKLSLQKYQAKKPIEEKRRHLVMKPQHQNFSFVKPSPHIQDSIAGVKLNKRAKSSAGSRPPRIVSRDPEVVSIIGSGINPSKKQFDFRRQSDFVDNSSRALLENEKIYDPLSPKHAGGHQNISLLLSSHSKGKSHRTDSKQGQWMTSNLLQGERPYPVPFRRLNQDLKYIRKHVGFQNSGTAANPSDPNSMMDQGPTRNTVYNANIYAQPAPAQHLDLTTRSSPRSSVITSRPQFMKARSQHSTRLSSYGKQKQSASKPKSITQKFNEIKLKIQNNNTLKDLSASCSTKDLDPLHQTHQVVLTNDCTKNISQSIFTPGMVNDNSLFVRLNEMFRKKENSQQSMNRRSSYEDLKIRDYDDRQQPEAVEEPLRQMPESGEGMISSEVSLRIPDLKPTFTLQTPMKGKDQKTCGSLVSSRKNLRKSCTKMDQGDKILSMERVDEILNANQPVYEMETEEDDFEMETVPTKSTAPTSQLKAALNGSQKRKMMLSQKAKARLRSIKKEINEEVKMRKKLELEMESVKSTICKLSDIVAKTK